MRQHHNSLQIGLLGGNSIDIFSQSVVPETGSVKIKKSCAQTAQRAIHCGLQNMARELTLLLAQVLVRDFKSLLNCHPGWLMYKDITVLNKAVCQSSHNLLWSQFQGCAPIEDRLCPFRLLPVRPEPMVVNIIHWHRQKIDADLHMNMSH